jgi:hypothetical protein
MKKLILSVLIGFCIGSTSSYAGNWFTDALNWIQANGEASMGVGIPLGKFKADAIKPTAVQHLTLCRYEYVGIEWSPGIEASQYLNGDPLVGVGVGVSWKLLKVGQLSDLRFPLFRAFSELRGTISLTLGADDLFDGKVNGRSAMLCASLGWKF